MKLQILLLVSVVASALPLAYGHHSIAGAYDSSSSFKLEAVVAEFRFVNPHPFLIVDVKTATGGIEKWKLEMDNRRELSGIGMSENTFKSGEQIVVVGQLAREQPQALYIRRLDRPADGFRYEQVGSSPRVNFRPR
jgi:hypothetical protein